MLCSDMGPKANVRKSPSGDYQLIRNAKELIRVVGVH